MSQSLYRKYRPKDFGEISGQNHIITTLQNELEMHKISHAYLFCGPRGVGKTTVARILAKAVNCQKLEKTTGKTFGKGPNPLLLSVRSGAAVSMPGMMDTVLNLGLNAETVQAMIDLTGNERFVMEICISLKINGLCRFWGAIRPL